VFGVFSSLLMWTTPVHEMCHLIGCAIDGVEADWVAWNRVMPRDPTLIGAWSGCIGEVFFLGVLFFLIWNTKRWRMAAIPLGHMHVTVLLTYGSQDYNGAIRWMYPLMHEQYILAGKVIFTAYAFMVLSFIWRGVLESWHDETRAGSKGRVK
jgi:hypothetical protein